MIFTSPKLTTPPDGPFIYLNGPIQGAVNWQRDAIAIIGELSDQSIHIANPRAKRFSGKPEESLLFETAFIERAAQQGSLLFWLAKETAHRCNRAYSQGPRFELGEWAARSKAGLARIAVGIERGFTGGPYLRRRLQLSYPNVVVCSSLRQTCAAAVELALSTPTALAYPFLKTSPPGLQDLVKVTPR